MKFQVRAALLALVLTAAGQIFTASAQVPRFLPTVSYPVPGASMVVLADINGDGILDLITANGVANTGDGGVSVLLGIGNGTFHPAKKIVAGGSPSQVLVGDFNGDGIPDIAVANEPNPEVGIVAVGGPQPNSISILLGNGNGTFRPSIDTLTTGAVGMVAADFNGDGRLDLAVSPGDAGTIQILLNHGDGTFAVSDTTVSGLFGVLTGDFNRDGKPDLMAAGFVMLGNGDGTFTTGQGLDTFADIAGDFNGDGIIDLASLFVSDGRFIAGLITLGRGDGTFAPTLISDFNGYGIVAADFDGDGKMDIFGTGGPVGGGINPPIGGLALGVGDGTFTFGGPGFGAAIGEAFSASFPAAGDLDGNKSPDIVIANGSALLVALNTSSNPPLLAQLSTNVTFVVGGAPGANTVTGTISLGGPAPAAGATITLASNNPAATFPNGKTVKIPAKGLSATFVVSTAAVKAATPVTISAAYRSTTLTTQITVVPTFTLASVSVAPTNPIGMFGGDAAVGTITLSGPAANGTVVTLASANPAAVTVPSTVAVPPGATTVTFPISAQHVAADTSVVISAMLGATTRTSTVTVRKETATVTITKAEYVAKKGQLTLEATSTDRVITLQVFNPVTGAQIGTLPLVNVGKFTGQYNVAGPLTSIAAQSSVGGLSIVTVVQK